MKRFNVTQAIALFAFCAFFLFSSITAYAGPTLGTPTEGHWIDTNTTYTGTVAPYNHTYEVWSWSHDFCKVDGTTTPCKGSGTHYNSEYVNIDDFNDWFFGPSTSAHIIYA